MNTTTRLLKQLMEFRPVSSDVARVNASVEFLRKYLVDAGLYTKVEKLEGREILYAAARRTKTPSILFNAHLDVVPADEKTFRFRERNGWIWGRGSGDCLGNCAVLARALVKCSGRADAGAIFSTDEEIGGETTVHMIKKGYRGKMVLVLDTTSSGYEIAVAHKGVLTLRLVASGRACHGSSPWLGKNAIDRLIQGYAKIKPLFPPVRPGDEWHTTCSANVISGGTVFNKVPDHAEMLLDIRYTGTMASARALAGKVRRVSGLKAEVHALFPSILGDKQDPALSGLRQLMRRHFKRPIGVIRLNGATDARHFNVLNVPIAMLGVPYLNPHAVNERAYVKGMMLFQDMLEDLCKKGLPGLG